MRKRTADASPSRTRGTGNAGAAKPTTPKKAVTTSAAKSSTTSTKTASAAQLSAEEAERWRKWRVRTITTWTMIPAFCLLTYFGHLALVGLVLVLSHHVFAEIMSHVYDDAATPPPPSIQLRSRVIAWWLYETTVLLIYGRQLFTRFPTFFAEHWATAALAHYHAFVVYCLYLAAFLAFVASLERPHYKHQFLHFCWALCALVIAIAQTSFHVANIFEGLFWFFLPCSLVICNDIWAYMCGFFFGRTSLTQLSPKKTWEGFIGAFFATLLFSVLWSWVLLQFHYFFMCPRVELLVHPAECTVHPVFVAREYALPQLLRAPLAAVGVANASGSVTLMPAQLHAVIYAAFASLIAPFGGFFASGLKRAVGIKDWGDTIPGHGGATDRFDCQVIMGTFANLYFVTFVKNSY